ncbi:SprT-like domain-containing protein [Corticicoccus populi]|uniref:SprT-like domain-containing protein n=1 Tax=Corticicoccus populi TaxID=1812821 RepID=A0ABW5WYF0_9STAP
MKTVDLEYYADQFLKRHFNIPLSIPIRISGRMTSKLGAFKIQYQGRKMVSSEIVMSANFIHNNHTDTILDVLYHECVHYALFSLGRPFRDSDKEFISTLKSLGISETKTYQYKGITHLYACSRCNYQFTKNMKGYEKRYRCRYCQKRFVYKGTIHSSPHPEYH